VRESAALSKDLEGVSPQLTTGQSNHSAKVAGYIIGVLVALCALASIGYILFRKRITYNCRKSSDSIEGVDGGDKNNVTVKGGGSVELIPLHPPLCVDGEPSPSVRVCGQPPPPHLGGRRPDDKLPDIVFCVGGDTEAVSLNLTIMSPRLSEREHRTLAVGISPDPRYSPSPKLTHAVRTPQSPGARTPQSPGAHTPQSPLLHGTEMALVLAADDAPYADGESSEEDGEGEEGEGAGMADNSICDILNGYHSGDNMDEDEIEEDEVF